MLGEGEDFFVFFWSTVASAFSVSGDFWRGVKGRRKGETGYWVGSERVIRVWVVGFELGWVEGRKWAEIGREGE